MTSGQCPEWLDAVPAAKMSSFQAALQATYLHVLENAGRSAPGESDIKRWHRAMFADVVPVPYYAGNWRGVYRDKPCLETDVFVDGVPGAAVPTVAATMRELERAYKGQASTLELRWPTLTPAARVQHLVLLIAEAVGTYIRIHPFLNGNGRTSRVLWAALLARYGLPTQARIAPRPDPPYGQIMAEAMKGDIRPLQLHILRCLAGTVPSEPTP